MDSNGAVRSLGFRWGTSHWLLTVALIVITSAFISFYAHVNVGSSNGNQFLSVAATLASIILAVVAIFIAVSQLIYASHQGNQLDVRLAELKSTVVDLKPIHRSVSDLTGLVSNLKDDQKDFINRAGKALLAQAPSSDAEGEARAADDDSLDGVKEALADKILGANTNLFFAAIGVVVSARGKSLQVTDLKSIAVSVVDEEPKTKSSLARESLPTMSLAVASLLKNLDLAKFPNPEDETKDSMVEIDEYFCAKAVERISGIEDKLRERDSSGSIVADLYKKVLPRMKRS